MSTGVFLRIGDDPEETELSFYKEVVLHIADRTFTFAFVEYTDKEGVTHWGSTADMPNDEQRRKDDFKSLDELKAFMAEMLEEFKQMGFKE